MSNATSRQKSTLHKKFTRINDRETGKTNQLKFYQKHKFKLQTIRRKVTAKIPLSSNTISIKKPTTKKGIRSLA